LQTDGESYALKLAFPTLHFIVTIKPEVTLQYWGFGHLGKLFLGKEGEQVPEPLVSAAIKMWGSV